MQIVEENLRDNEGEIKLIPETLDDLWHLRFIIEKGDVVFATTKRASQSSDKLRSDKEMVTVRLGIEVEKVEFHRFANRLRVSGKIVAGIEESGYHTLNITVGKELSIIKKWKPEQLERLRRAVEDSNRPEIVMLTIEEGYAVAGVLRQWGVEEIFEERMGYGKGMGDSRKEFFGEVAAKLESFDFKYLIVAGPGFAKNDFLDFLKERYPEMAKNAVVVDVSSVGSRGFIEILKRRVVDKIVGEVRLAEEAEYIDRLLEGIAKGERVAYGLDEVREAHNYRAIEVLLVADEFLLEEREKWDVDGLLREVEESGGKVVIMSTEFEPGKRLMSLGGIAALLRFNVKG
ncbi:mRNA surveillance protein pelota [Archaeoglobus fulgidus]|uniref:Protein pelota homolog n=2 Tax=Archaeoglobus fulgidus TaxID=2234 RepID=PELO_ARCFU|nr:mRNA surveillance protein pelota [Archaeoglobus fulgidus]O29421.1 RecName: Full=Protein pelota homolog [Archaeoglobus fulgidus DSM 4304]AAB90402.1 cell division protein pelota (pelA) [Archaeoglobus fulgidus DSM 4304]